MRVNLGCGQITWRGVPKEAVLEDIRQAGYDGAPWGGRDGASAAEVRALFDRYGLAPAPGYLGGEFWDADRRDELLATARRYAETSQALGLTEVYVSAGGFGVQAPSGRTRKEVVGRATEADSLPEREFRQLTDTVQAIGEVLLERGVRCCYHSHGGTFVESEDEIERLLDAADPEVVFLGPDTGHLAWAGIDVTDFVRRHAPRIKTMHLKDVDFGVRDRGVEAGWDYATFEKHAVWAEIGEGGVDFAGVFALLDDADFDGWLIVETDVTQKATPLESAVVSRENLRKLGI